MPPIDNRVVCHPPSRRDFRMRRPSGKRETKMPDYDVNPFLLHEANQSPCDPYTTLPETWRDRALATHYMVGYEEPAPDSLESTLAYAAVQ